MQPVSATIFNIMRFATHDGPGIRTTVFFKGCPLDCRWCHNPESQDFRPEVLYFAERCRHCGECVAVCRRVGPVPGPATAECRRCGRCTEVCAAEARQMAGRRVTVVELLAEIEKDLVFYEESGGGVTLSGGEPAAQPRFVEAFLRSCREHGIHTVLETCGFAHPETFRRVAMDADAVLFDLKLVSDSSHRAQTGVSNARILQNLEELWENGRAVIVRIPVIPGINDGAAETEAFAGYLARFPGCNVELLPYHRTGAPKYARLGRTYRLPDTPEPAADVLGRMRDRLAGAGLQVTIGG